MNERKKAKTKTRWKWKRILNFLFEFWSHFNLFVSWWRQMNGLVPWLLFGKSQCQKKREEEKAKKVQNTKIEFDSNEVEHAKVMPRCAYKFNWVENEKEKKIRKNVCVGASRCWRTFLFLRRSLQVKSHDVCRPNGNIIILSKMPHAL